VDRTRQGIIAVVLSLLLLSFGTCGYMLLEGWSLLDSLYMTVITLATVGYGEVHPVGPGGRTFTIVLIILGVGLFLYVIGNLVQFLVEGRIRQILGRRKVDREIGRLRDHYLVCGYGRMGRSLCRYLQQRRLPLLVLEAEHSRVEVMEEDGVLYLLGDATSEGNLRKAGIQRAKGLMTALGSDADNVFLVLTAKQLNPQLFVVARANINANKKTLYAAGADVVVSPYESGARRMAHSILRPNVIQFLELAFADEGTDIYMEELPVGATSSLVGKSLLESGIRRDLNLIIIAMKKADGTMVFNPAADTVIEAAATLIVIGAQENLLKLDGILNPIPGEA